MNGVDVLLIGGLERRPDGSVDPEATFSTSTLVSARGKKILVDTSASFVRASLEDAFRDVKRCRPEEVEIVVLTHAHPDHTGNLALFPDAEVYVHAGEAPVPGAVIVEEDGEIVPGVELIHTPGHTAGSMTVLVRGVNTVAIAGDAIPLRANYAEGKPPALNIDLALAMESMRRIASLADVIIPGHDRPFAVRGDGQPLKPRGHGSTHGRRCAGSNPLRVPRLRGRHRARHTEGQVR